MTKYFIIFGKDADQGHRGLPRTKDHILYHQGSTQRQISQDMRVSIGYVNKVVQFYEQSNSSLPAPRKTPVRNIFTADVVEYVESEKLCKPSVYTTEIQQRLLFDGIFPPGQLPSQSGI